MRNFPNQQTRYPAETTVTRYMDVTSEAAFFRELPDGIPPGNMAYPIIMEPPFFVAEAHLFEHFLHTFMYF